MLFRDLNIYELNYFRSKYWLNFWHFLQKSEPILAIQDFIWLSPPQGPYFQHLEASQIFVIHHSNAT